MLCPMEGPCVRGAETESSKRDGFEARSGVLWFDLHTLDRWERDRGPEKGPKDPKAGSHMVSAAL